MQLTKDNKIPDNDIKDYSTSIIIHSDNLIQVSLAGVVEQSEIEL